MQAPKGNHDDVIRCISDTFRRQYEDGSEDPDGTSFGSGKPRSSTEEGKGKGVDGFHPDEIQEIQREEEDSEYEDEVSINHEIDDLISDVLGPKLSGGTWCL